MNQRSPSLPELPDDVILITGHVTGWITSFEQGHLTIDHHDNPHGPLVCRTTVPQTVRTWHQLASREAEVLLVFERERSDRPILVGVLQAPGTITDHLELEASERITLRCGDATLQMRQDGRIVVRGQHVETRARRTNRIKGGHVKIN